MSEARNNQIRTQPSRRIEISRIAPELDNLWENLYQDLGDGQAITRACMSNLIVYYDTDAETDTIGQIILDIVQAHPARVLLLTERDDAPESGIEAFVSGHYCALTSGWQVCSEQIRIVSDDQSKGRLPSVVRANLVGDLPTTLWWASKQPPPEAGKLFFKLAMLADQIIYDSIGWHNPTSGMQAMARWVAAGRKEYVIFNLAWRRINTWRSLISQVLDPAVHPGALTRVSSLSIEHGPHSLSKALLLLGWLSSLLGWKPTEGNTSLGKVTHWRFNTSGQSIHATVTRLASGDPDLYSLRWSWKSDSGTRTILFSLLEDARLGVVEENSDLPARVIQAPELKKAQLVAAQMAHRARDKVFEHALAVGNQMAGVLNK